MSAEAEAPEWELSKENVQPIRRGRKVAALGESLAGTPDERAAKIAEQKRCVRAERYRPSWARD